MEVNYPMENTLFGSNRTKLTGRTNDFNLDTGLYEAMYEQSQMELKILEAMIKADSLSRKYIVQGKHHRHHDRLSRIFA